MASYSKFDPNNPPPPLMTGEPGSFAMKTLKTRKPAMLQQVIADYGAVYPPPIIEAVHQLHDELTLNQALRPVETAAPDGPSWAEAWRPHRGQGWLEIPWYFAEAFLYRRLLEATNYFGGHGRNLARWQGVDPFFFRKQAEFQSDAPWQVLAAALNQSTENSPDSLRVLLNYGLWVNRIDLSYNQVAQSAGGQISIEQERENLLVDDTEAVVQHLIEQTGVKSLSDHIDFVCDNTGTELLLDLALADFLLRFDWTERVVLHVKAHPTYVSDAAPVDVDQAIAAITAKPDEPFITLGARLRQCVVQERLQVRAHVFWNSSKFFWEIPAALQARLAQAKLVIFKGDANYRRLLGDSRWPTVTPMAAAVPYFPAPFVALRTMKSDPVVGLQPGQAEALNQEDPEWRVNGKRGVIQALI